MKLAHAQPKLSLDIWNHPLPGHLSHAHSIYDVRWRFLPTGSASLTAGLAVRTPLSGDCSAHQIVRWRPGPLAVPFCWPRSRTSFPQFTHHSCADRFLVESRQLPARVSFKRLSRGRAVPFFDDGVSHRRVRLEKKVCPSGSRDAARDHRCS